MKQLPRKRNRERKSDIHGTYYYNDKPYKILYKSKIKIEGRWEECVIYKCLYKNPDGLIWVRMKDEFFKLFATNKPDNDWEEI